jgi:hypothetical protein
MSDRAGKKLDTATLWKAVPALTGAVLAGLPSLLAVLLALHWAGAVLAVGLFALWCARLPRAVALGG